MDRGTDPEVHEAELLLKLIAQAEEDVEAGRLTPQEEVFAAAWARLAGSRPATTS